MKQHNHIALNGFALAIAWIGIFMLTKLLLRGWSGWMMGLALVEILLVGLCFGFSFICLALHFQDKILWFRAKNISTNELKSATLFFSFFLLFQTFVEQNISGSLLMLGTALIFGISYLRSRQQDKLKEKRKQ